MENQQTLILIKPDGVRRHLIGEIIRRFEEAGLVVKELKMLQATSELLATHYSESEDYYRSIGEKAAAHGNKVDEPVSYGREIVKALKEYMMEGPIVAMILEAPDAIALARKVTGFTDPSVADKGTIRGDLGEDSIASANAEGRSCQNLIHASGNPEEAAHEIKIWFGN